MVMQCYYQKCYYQSVVVKNQEILKNKKKEGLLTSLVIKTPLSKISSLDNILFYVFWGIAIMTEN